MMKKEKKKKEEKYKLVDSIKLKKIEKNTNNIRLWSKFYSLF